jgi:CRP/FNR family cyclic AMP-dependent transcriptional regulator
VRRTFERSFADGDVVFDEGDEGSHLYVIQSGQVEICRQSRAGKRVVARLGPGEFFGEMSVVLGEPRTARAVAIGATELLELDGATLEGMCIEQPEIAIRMIQRLAVRLIAAERRLAALGLDELVAPLIRYLAAQADLQDCEDELRLRTSLRELAAGCQLSLHETYQALHQLMDQKLVRVNGEEIVVPDCNALGAALTRFSVPD